MSDNAIGKGSFCNLGGAVAIFKICQVRVEPKLPPPGYHKETVVKDLYHDLRVEVVDDVC